MVGHHPISVKDQSRLHEFGETVLPGMFQAYALHAVGNLEKETSWSQSVRSWTGIRARRLSANEVLMQKNGNHFKCPIADGTVKLS